MNVIKVTVGWSGKNYSASLSDNVPGAVVFTADTYGEVLKKAPETLDLHVGGMIANGDKVPHWLRTGDYKFEFDKDPRS